MKEPNVTIKNVDETVGYVTEPADNRMNILCPVVSPSGPVELTRVTGPTQFLNLYFGGRGVTAEDHMSAVYARSLVSRAPIWVKRAVRSTVKGGVTSSLAEPFYVDENYVPFEGIKVKFSPKGIVSVSSFVSTLTSGSDKKVIVKSNSIYTQTEADIKDKPQIKSTRTSKVKVTLSISGSTTSETTVVIGDTTYKLPAGSSNLNSIVNTMAKNGNLPDLANAGVITTSGVKEGASVTAIGFCSPIAITVNGDAKVTVGTSEASVYIGVLKTESENIETWELEDAYAIFESSVQKYLFHFGEKPTSVTDAQYVEKLGDGNPTFGEFMESLSRAISASLMGDACSANEIVVPNMNQVSVKDEGSLEVTSEEINKVSDVEKYAVISKFPMETPLMLLNIEHHEEYDVVKVSYKDMVEEWNVSMDSTMVDGYGVSMYYERVNSNSELIQIVPLNGELSASLSTTFGNEVTGDYSGVKEMCSALEAISENQESYVDFDFITDGGVVNSTLSSVVLRLCEEYNSMYAVSCPTEKNKALSKATRANILTNYRAIYIDEAQRAATIDKGSVVLPASYWYLSKRLDLANTTLEFAPIFGSTNGNIGMNEPLKKWKLSDREELLDSQILTLKRGAEGTYYLNQNLTCYDTSSYLQEDWIVLANNKIDQVAKAYCEGLKGRTITEGLMSEVTTTLSDLLANRMRVGTAYAPQRLVVKCDTSNNPISLQKQRKFRVDIYASYPRSVAYVLVYSHIQSLE